MPSCPSSLLPQHNTVPSDRRAHACTNPALTAIACRTPGTRPTPRWPAVVATPSCSSALPPQQSTVPPRSSAQFTVSPAATEVALRSRLTVTGDKLGSAVSRMPSRPALLLPQHLIVPSNVSAHVCADPPPIPPSPSARAAAAPLTASARTDTNAPRLDFILKLPGMRLLRVGSVADRIRCAACVLIFTAAP